jgi:hypothetical protein
MLIRDRSIMEKAMSITYEDIRAKQRELVSKYEDRKSQLHAWGYDLVNQFRDSLSLPSEFWKDSKGADRKYITIGYINDKGLFQYSPLAAIQLDDNFSLNFMLDFVIEDNPFDEQSIRIELSLNYNEEFLVVDIAKGKKVIKVAYPSEDGAFAEVSNAIKQLVINILSEQRL